MATRMQKPYLAPGDTVTVYADPVTRQKREGTVTLHQFLGKADGDHSGRLEWWEVHFHADRPGYYVNRWVGVIDRN